jgi:hypothetical protein
MIGSTAPHRRKSRPLDRGVSWAAPHDAAAVFSGLRIGIKRPKKALEFEIIASGAKIGGMYCEL